MENPTHLPTRQKFTLYRDADGIYVLESQQENGPIVDGVDVNEAIARMVEIIPVWDNLDDLGRGYVANSAHALKLCKEFEGAQMEVLNHSES